MALSHLIKNRSIWQTLRVVPVPIRRTDLKRDDAFLLVDSEHPIELGSVFDVIRPVEAVKILTKFVKDMVLIKINTMKVGHKLVSVKEPILLWVIKSIDQQDLLDIAAWAFSLRGDFDVCGNYYRPLNTFVDKLIIAMMLQNHDLNDQGLRETVAANRSINENAFPVEKSYLRAQKAKEVFKSIWMQKFLRSNASTSSVPSHRILSLHFKKDD